MNRNIAKCKLCGDLIESVYTHHFVRCGCGEIFIDGGKDYQRCGGGDLANILEPSEDEIRTYDEAPTGRLEEWQDGNYCDVKVLRGFIYQDKLRRFLDGTFIRTSRLIDPPLELVEGMVVETNNSRYLLGKPCPEAA